MITYLNHTVSIIIDYRSIPIIDQDVIYKDHSIVATASHSFSETTHFNLSWRKELSSSTSDRRVVADEDEQVTGELTLNGVFIGDLNWSTGNDAWPNITGTFRGDAITEGEARFHLVLSRDPSNRARSTPTPISFEIIIKKSEQNLYPNPNAYYDISSTRSSSSSRQTLNPIRGGEDYRTTPRPRSYPTNFHPNSPRPLTNFNPASPRSPRHHPYLSASLHSLPSQSPTRTISYNQMEEKVKELEIQLESMTSQVSFYQTSCGKLYGNLSSDQLIRYLEDRLKNEILAPDMRLTIAEARQESISQSEMNSQELIGKEVERMCGLLTQKS